MTNSLEGCRSIHLSYWRLHTLGHPLGHLTATTDPLRRPSRGGRIRTGDLLLPKQARYRATLRPAHQHRLPAAGYVIPSRRPGQLLTEKNSRVR